MKVFLSNFGHVFAALFPVINPPGMALLFIAMTRRAGRTQRVALAGRIALYAFVIINVSYYVGTFLLDFFDISLPVLRVAGGIVLVALAAWIDRHREHESAGGYGGHADD